MLVWLLALPIISHREWQWSLSMILKQCNQPHQYLDWDWLRNDAQVEMPVSNIGYVRSSGF